MSAMEIYLLSLLDGFRAIVLIIGLVLFFISGMVASNGMWEEEKKIIIRLAVAGAICFLASTVTPSKETVLLMKTVPYMTEGQRGEMNAKTLDDLMEVVSLWAKNQKEKQK